MKLYDYTNLLNVIREVDLETSKLNNLKRTALKNKCLDLEHKLLNSGILEDWCRLSKLGHVDYYNRWRNAYLNNVYDDSNEFMEYDRDWKFKIMMSSGSHWSDYLCLDPRCSVDKGKLVWTIMHSTNTTFFNGFRNEEHECKTKILVMETLMETYEDYRTHMLNGLEEAMNKKISSNAKLREEISKLI